MRPEAPEGESDGLPIVALMSAGSAFLIGVLAAAVFSASFAVAVGAESPSATVFPCSTSQPSITSASVAGAAERMRWFRKLLI